MFAEAYGLAGCLDSLDARARDEDEESLDGTTDVWHRVLATSRLLHQGSSFEDLRMPSYGGSLFDPSRFAFLTATAVRGLAVRVSDRVMLHVLRSVQVAVVDGEARRLSFRDIDVEQIGYIYEGLLGYSARIVDEVHIGLVGQRSAKRLEGEEPEIALARLEEYAASAPTTKTLAERLLADVKDGQPGAKPPTVSALTTALDAVPAQAESSLRLVAPHDAALRDRLRPFLGAIRLDLRGRPVVVAPGGLLVVETPSRRNAGAHYTPKALAEEVVTHALAPLVYSPGPHDTADAAAWRLRSKEEILALKVADIACGSGAFLVAAARYLADRLVEAWREDGAWREGGALEGHSADHAGVLAIRQVVASCIYGADINAMAVEMCKLSLWLVSLDQGLPFSFVDDRVLHGNSLLGLTDVRQLERLHISPSAAAAGYVQEGMTFSATDNTLMHVPSTLRLDERIAAAVRLRQGLTHVVEPSNPQRDGAAMRRQAEQSRAEVAPLARIADGVVAAGLRLGGKPGKALDAAFEDLRLAVQTAWPEDGDGDDRWLDGIVDEGLTPRVDTDEPRWRPLHWVLEVPDVMTGPHPGFDAVIGNPPFKGGTKVSGVVGDNVREWMVHTIADSVKGQADLVAYFFLRTRHLLKQSGTLGLIATNTVAQGATREVGLQQMTANGFAIRRAIQSKPWPAASATLEYAAVWGTWAGLNDEIPREADGVETARVSALLEPEGRIMGAPIVLQENSEVAFAGVKIFGPGFVLDRDEYWDLMEADPRSADVIYPYPHGKDDVNGSASLDATRWVINFGDRSEIAAATYETAFSRVERLVRPVRMGAPASYPRRVRDCWWQYEAPRAGLAKKVLGLKQVIVTVQTSATQAFALVPSGQVFDQKLVVFATQSTEDLAVLSSSPHRYWVIGLSNGAPRGPRTPFTRLQTSSRRFPVRSPPRN
ncbi:MAG: Eco57I restriction-modification methylase domain-containing protein, partial [Phycicoccus sp.]